jgi:hypothetical protein
MKVINQATDTFTKFAKFLPSTFLKTPISSFEKNYYFSCRGSKVDGLFNICSHDLLKRKAQHFWRLESHLLRTTTSEEKVCPEKFK